MSALGQNFVVENGTGLVNATSYVSTDFANTYSTTYNNQDWLSLDALTMQQYLMDATICIDRLYGQDFYSLVISHGTYRQALLFPRFTMVVNGIQIIQTGELPFQLTQAVCEVALMELRLGSDALYPQPNLTPFLGSQSVGLGGLKQTQVFSVRPKAEKYTNFWKVEQILYPLLKQTNNPTYLSL